MDLADLCNAYDSQLRELFDRHAPLISRTASTKQRDPWDTEEVLDALRVKRRAERRFRKTKCENDYRIFCDKRDMFRKTLQTSKTNYLSDIIAESSRDPKTLFARMNKIMHKKNENPLPGHSSAQSLANDFNRYFKDKVETIRQTFDDDLTPAYSNDTDFCGIAFEHFEPVTEGDISLIIKSSKPKSCELDPIPTTLLKQCSTELTPIITRIANLSLKTGSLPDIYKHAIIRPLIKKTRFGNRIK